jgi:hypothetical protein
MRIATLVFAALQAVAGLGFIPGLYIAMMGGMEVAGGAAGFPDPDPWPAIMQHAPWYWHLPPATFLGASVFCIVTAVLLAWPDKRPTNT